MENIKQGVQYPNKSKIVWRNILLITFILSVIATVLFFAVYKYRQRDDYVKYTEKGVASYKVNLKEDYNPYGNGVSSSNMQYLSSKLEGVNTNLHYELNAQNGDIKYNYTYTLKEVVQVVSKETGKTIISYENLIKTEADTCVKGNKLVIDENYYTEYWYHNTKITQFVNQQSDLRTHAIDCSLKLVLDINLKGECQDSENGLKKSPTIYINIPLKTDTVSITTGNNITIGEGKIVLYENMVNDKAYLITSCACAGFAILLFVAWYIYNKLTMSQEDKFRKLVNKIESNYGSYIQQISQPISNNYEQIIEFDKFVDLLEVANIIKQPVLIEKQTNDEIVYVVPESSIRLYMFKLNKDSVATSNKDIKPKKLYKQEKPEQLLDDIPDKDVINTESKNAEKVEAQKPVKVNKKNLIKPAKVKLKKQANKKSNKSASEDQQHDIEPIMEEGPVDEGAPDHQNVVKSAKINRTMNNYTKQTSDKEKIYDIIETDLKKFDKKDKEDEDKKTLVKKSSSIKSVANKSDTKKNINSKTKKTATKSKSVKVKKKSKSPTAVNLSLGDVDDGKIINVSIETVDTDK